MSDFKIGDKVRHKDWEPFEDGEYVKIAKSSCNQQLLLVYGAKHSYNGVNYVKAEPRPHANLIVAWAYGAEIECESSVPGRGWYPVTTSMFSESSSYKIRGTNTRRDQQIERMEAEIKKLAEELEGLKNE